MDIKINYMIRRKTFCGWKILPRCVNDFELVYILDGYGEVIIDDVKYNARSGDLFCFKPDVKHSLILNKEPYMEFFGLHFFPQQDELIREIPDYIHVKEKYWIESMLKQLYREYQMSGYLNEWKKEIMIQQLLCDVLVRQHTVENPANTLRIQSVIDLIHKDPFEHYTMDILLKQAGVKKSLFLQAFRKITGTTPVQYITNIRLESACELLSNSNLQVSEIATQCGFADPFYFSRCFKKKYMMSPKKYRCAVNV